VTYVEPYCLGGKMYNVVNHANTVSGARFGALSADSSAKKLAETTPVLFTPTVVIVTVPAALAMASI
jgi:hypothetical protein